MHILIVQAAGEHSANKHYKEACCFARAFDRLGHKVMLYGPGYGLYCVQWKDLVAQADAILMLENWGGTWIPDMGWVRKPKIFWSIDSHKVRDNHIRFCKDNAINVCLACLKPDVPKFRDAGIVTEWFPLCYPSDYIFPNDRIAKEYNIGFCGNTGDRGYWLDDLAREFPLFRRDIMVLGDEMVRAIQHYRIHWNRNETYTLNGRTYETLGAGTCLLTNKTDGLGELFTIGTDLLTYDDFNDCVEKIRWLLDKPDVRETIALNGHKTAESLHTYDKRAEAIIELLKAI